jgi:hypothetical protein
MVRYFSARYGALKNSDKFALPIVCYTDGLPLQHIKNSGGVSKIKGIFLIIYAYAQFADFAFTGTRPFKSL